MKKFLKKKRVWIGLGTIAVVAIVAVTATNAFFSDTEKSTGNQFTAGGIDLQVDSTSHYNGLVCEDDVWVNHCTATGDNLLLNGDFEQPVVATAQKWDIFLSGTIGLGWIVDWESTQATYGGATRPAPALQEMHRGVNGWLPQNGNQYTELDSDWDGPSGSMSGEPALVKIYQDIATTPGTKYELRYHFSPRPNTASSENTLLIRIDGTQVASHTATGASNTDWAMYTQEFVATAATTRVEFAGSGTANSFGVFLDNVSLREMACDSTSDLEGAECDGTWELTDLGPTNKFFNFSDIKPGDWGEVTVSLHVSDNDAYSCALIDNMQNDDLSLTEPEQTAGDTTDGAGNGELAQEVNFFAWADDGDNIWEQGEIPLFSNLFGPASDVLNGVAYPLFTPQTGVMEATTTKYVGLQWCFGTMTVDTTANTIACDGSTVGNAAQTDQLSADISFYVEQSRNNPNFVCPQPATEQVAP
ncbi:MAG: DUF642 domain-containing protein [Patescibacteria group bacterium]